MSKLQNQLQKLDLTREELSNKSEISKKTIQDIGSGKEPKRHTLKNSSKTVEIKKSELIERVDNQVEINTTLLRVINLSSLPFTLIPPANIVIPLIIMFDRRQFNPLTKQIVSIQIIWFIFTALSFIACSIMKNWFSYGNNFILLVMIFLVMINFIIILRNTAEIERTGKLLFRLNFSLI